MTLLLRAELLKLRTVRVATSSVTVFSANPDGRDAFSSAARFRICAGLVTELGRGGPGGLFCVAGRARERDWAPGGFASSAAGQAEMRCSAGSRRAWRSQ